eukprot:MONOS_10062.1-p1 / transcript=MONOS_10062.1 / gene=MONOS_10062 / organism=Monocercomonoides_exilis_PA203 / gene_product=myb domain-containing protein / transcript_product=myb domain-containing protein / location=Mono_scaffold00441:10956-12482(-) / protein_length=508 / sequence_SO=supercontig / SO=protein_coding / is_pseudo=false
MHMYSSSYPSIHSTSINNSSSFVNPDDSISQEWTIPFAQAVRTRQALQFPPSHLLEHDCGKLQCLAVLLSELRKGGHRCLIFTQMSRMLDILEGFVSHHGYRYLRLDGSTPIDKRQSLMELFNSNSKIFQFLLSTRSGGIGVNLTGADTVIFYDTDWNPAMDAQAEDRAHRIGQTREVHVYRLISTATVEENILKRAIWKRKVEAAVTREGDFTCSNLVRARDVRSYLGVGENEEKDRSKLEDQLFDHLKGDNVNATKANEMQRIGIDSKKRKEGFGPLSGGASEMQILSLDEIKGVFDKEIEEDNQKLEEEEDNDDEEEIIDFSKEEQRFSTQDMDGQGEVADIINESKEIQQMMNEVEDDEDKQAALNAQREILRDKSLLTNDFDEHLLASPGNMPASPSASLTPRILRTPNAFQTPVSSADFATISTPEPIQSQEILTQNEEFQAMESGFTLLQRYAIRYLSREEDELFEMDLLKETQKMKAETEKHQKKIQELILKNDKTKRQR